jgi:drug/metabolite transporter (DMT)-like permease
MGEIAGLVTALLWAFNSIQFTLAGRRVGSAIVNRTRLILAVLFLSLAHLVLYGNVWPIDVCTFRWTWLGLSGVIGLVVGDSFLFQSFVLIGPRRAMLLMTSAPVISALLAWVWLGQRLEPVEIGAILVTVAGIAWVISEKETRDTVARDEELEAHHYVLGVLLGLGGALGQALGLVVARHGMGGDFPPLSAALIRMIVATGAIWLIALATRKVGATWRAFADRRALLLVLSGAFVGPFLGVWLSMVAVQNAPVGIASTLMALSPILLVPLEHWIFHSPITLRSVLGTVVALVGTAFLFLH